MPREYSFILSLPTGGRGSFLNVNSSLCRSVWEWDPCWWLSESIPQFYDSAKFSYGLGPKTWIHRYFERILCVDDA